MDTAAPAVSPSPEPDWLALVGRARGGDAGAFGALVENFWPQLVRLARMTLARDGDAEDLVQEAFLLAWRRIGDLREDQLFPAWMQRIVVRRCLRHLRSFSQLVHQVQEGFAQARADERAQVTQLLGKLSARQRAVLCLSDLEGYSDREVAESLDLSPATVRVHRHQARLRLRALLGDRP